MPRYKVCLQYEVVQMMAATVFVEASSELRARRIAIAEAGETEFTAESCDDAGETYITEIARVEDVS